MHDDFIRIENLFPHVTDWADSSDKGYKWSENLWVSQKDGWIALYRPLNLGLVYFKQDFFEELINGVHTITKDRLTKLIDEGILIPANDDRDRREHENLISKARSGVFRFICILPTTSCDLNCLYCHQRPDAGQERYMTTEEADAGLDKCAEVCSDKSKPVDILIYGGEPLQAFPVCQRIFARACGDKPIFSQPVRLSFTTSGIGLTEEQVAVLVRYDVFVIISIDGMPEVNDRVRRSGDGRSSFRHASEAYNLLKKEGVRVGLSVTIGKHNIDTLSEQVEFLLNNFEPNDIGLNAFLHRRGEGINPFQVNSRSAFDQFIDAFEITRERGVYAEQPFRRLKPFVFRQPLLKDCSSPGERLVLAPGGLMGFCDSCYPDGVDFYTVEEFPGRDQEEYLKWASLSSVEMPQCRSCPAMSVCGGACRYDALKASGRYDGVEPERCSFEKTFLNWTIWELFALRKSRLSDPYFPQDEERRALFGNVMMHEQNQPFTAGSYSE
ncbi:hypothetical protein CEE37_09360 [candidate division LCP-89 bacterium B3_LCP]|uniref:Radical SAM core domain-containing protein n=1 Tax=candidate division LCP-89 bacterium B3_LCP TaxID=2012998 RepID=A0A532UY91_UNCL8|nr:MAG: hypothetical protein CEE37_09360 [candidate division LCP-89 bacterium B3_LCP]